MTAPVAASITHLVGAIAPQLADGYADDIADWLDHHEWGLAMDSLADAIYTSGITLSPEQQDEVKQLLAVLDVPEARYAFLGLGVRS